MRKKVESLRVKLERCCGKDGSDAKTKAIELLKAHSPFLSIELDAHSSTLPAETEGRSLGE
jgi:hypothetical protein